MSSWTRHDFLTVEGLLGEARRLQALDGFPKGAAGAWFSKRGLPGIRWIATERRDSGYGGRAGLVMDGHWDLAARPERDGCGHLAFAVLMAEHVHDWPELGALATTVLAHDLVRLVPQSEEYVERLRVSYARNTFLSRDRVLLPCLDRRQRVPVTPALVDLKPPRRS